MITAAGNTGKAIQSGGSVEVNGGTVSAIKDNGMTIDAYDTVTVRGGAVKAAGYGAWAITTADAVVEGGVVESTGDSGVAISASGNVLVKGGAVKATTGDAISDFGGGDITVSGGLVFAYGSKIHAPKDQDNDAVVHAGGKYELNASKDPGSPNNGVVAAWTPAGTKTYTAGTATSLIVNPAGAAIWSNSGGVSGIKCANGANAVFLEIPEAKVQ